jgi:cardiolipin synthase
MNRLKFLPNILTTTRLLLSLPLCFLVAKKKMAWAFFILFLAGSTDFMDGAIAREWNLKSQLGSWLDPIADKTLITSLLFTLTFMGVVPFWILGITLGRDLMIALGTLYLFRKKGSLKVQPLLSGKLSVVFQTLVLWTAMLSTALQFNQRVLSIVCFISAIISLYSLTAYYKMFLALSGTEKS